MISPAFALLLAAQAAARRPAPPPSPEPDAIAETLFLIGDAGKPAKGGEPVLIALRAQLEGAGGRATVVFLGDNLYPEGLPAPNHPERAEMERRLDDQVEAVKDAAARVVFIPGNHDWARGKPGGWEAVRRQERRIEERGGPTVVHRPGVVLPLGAGGLHADRLPTGRPSAAGRHRGRRGRRLPRGLRADPRVAAHFLPATTSPRTSGAAPSSSDAAVHGLAVAAGVRPSNSIVPKAPPSFS